MSIESSPEKYGLRLLKSLDVAGAYEFNQIIVVQDVETGRLYAGHDSGCSCPIPFEAIGRDALTPIATRADLDAFAREHWHGSYFLDRFETTDAAVAELVSFEWPASADA